MREKWRPMTFREFAAVWGSLVATAITLLFGIGYWRIA